MILGKIQISNELAEDCRHIEGLVDDLLTGKRIEIDKRTQLLNRILECQDKVDYYEDRKIQAEEELREYDATN